MLIRSYQAKDLETVIDLWRASWHSSSGYQHPRVIADWRQRWHKLEQTHRIVVVEDQSQLVAFAALAPERRVLSQLFVSPDGVVAPI